MQNTTFFTNPIIQTSPPFLISYSWILFPSFFASFIYSSTYFCSSYFFSS
nr:MAG TPA: hypothetical protein [Bacteriophage sp.]